jgi:hypothetical protein
VSPFGCLESVEEEDQEIPGGDFIAEIEIEGYSWQDLECMAQNRTRSRTAGSGLCTTKVQQA